MNWSPKSPQTIPVVIYPVPECTIAKDITWQVAESLHQLSDPWDKGHHGKNS